MTLKGARLRLACGLLGARGMVGSDVRGPRLLERLRSELRVRHYSVRTEDAYVAWVRRFVRFHGLTHPAQLGSEAISVFLTHIATVDRVSASTQGQALAALLFLYTHVLKRRQEELGEFVRARRPRRLPNVLTTEEVTLVLERMSGMPRLMASLLYGSGLRLLECARLRIKDLDFARGEVTVRDPKERRDRVTTLPRRLEDELRAHVERVRRGHQQDSTDGAGWVELPNALGRKYPDAGRQWPWQWVFPATRRYRHPQTGQVRRHHFHETALERAVHVAGLEARLGKRVTCHTLRHYAEHGIMRSGTSTPPKLRRKACVEAQFLLGIIRGPSERSASGRRGGTERLREYPPAAF